MSIKIKSKYKFSIASENAQYEGYTSEKLLTSFQAHTVPIYWGNKYVSEEFNREAFVDVNDYKNFDEVVKRVKEIDEDDDLWAYMVSQPWQTVEQKTISEERQMHYEKFIANIFSQPLKEAKRRPEGYHTGNYYKWFFEKKFPFDEAFLKNYLRKILENLKLKEFVKGLRDKKTPITSFEDFFKD